MLQAAGVSERGSVRPTNQDRFAIDEAHRVCVVADGLGGHRAGDVAARTAVDVVLDVVRGQHGESPFGLDASLSAAGNLIRTAVYMANQRVLEVSTSSSDYTGMGTTLVAALVSDGRLAVAHVGDSRLYRLGQDRCLRQLTGDDCWVSATAPDAREHPMRHVLTNVVGSRHGMHVHVVEEPICPGDRLLLTTDGVHGVLDDRRLEDLMTGADDLSEVANALVAAAILGGSRDNCTAVVARYSV